MAKSWVKYRHDYNVQNVTEPNAKIELEKHPRQPALSLHVLQKKYTPKPKAWAYPEEVRQKALQLYVDGMNLRRIARHLGLHHRTVSLWVKAQAAQLPDPPVPEQVKEAEMDELFTFIGDKKTKSSSSRS